MKREMATKERKKERGYKKERKKERSYKGKKKKNKRNE